MCNLLAEMDWIKIGSYLLIIIPTLFMGIVLGFYFIQDEMIFLGEKLPLTHQYNFKNTFEELNFKTPDGIRLNALLFKVDNPKGLIYYQHGNAGNLQGWGNYAGNFLNQGYDVLFYDYRGYGKSSGKIKKEHHLYDDARLVLEVIHKNYMYKSLIYYGNSLGTGVASKLAMDFPPSALILENPYFNFWDLINYHYPYLPSKLMSKYQIRTDKYLQKVTCPILLIHGTDDKTVPYSSSVRLALLREDIQFITIKSGVHNNLSDFNLYHAELGRFLNEVEFNK